MRRRLAVSVFLASSVSGLLLLHPLSYPYGPVVGGIVVAMAGANSLADGVRRGVLVGLALLPVVVVLLALVTTAPLADAKTGLSILFESLRGMGERGVVFYVVVAYFLTVYGILTGGIAGGVTGWLRGAFLEGGEP